MISRKQKIIWYLIFTQALLAMLGSLYLSNFGDPVANIIDGNMFPVGMGFYPCRLCWWARILMYPIVLLSALGIWKSDRNFTTPVLFLSVPGVLLEIYHYSIQKFIRVESEGCSLANPCSALSVDYFGFMTIPFLCLIAFVVITILSFWNVRLNTSS